MMNRIVLIGLLASGCYAGFGPQQQTLPEPVQVAGPPGGQMDQGYYQNPNQPQDPQAYQGDPSAYQGDPNGDPNAEPQDPNAQAADPQQDPQAMADVDDTEIDATLQGYGSWDEDPDYGRVWRPDATFVGADFTPYETCGSWVYTEYGPTFSCDYAWGWLPFHYGRWGWIGNRWGWVPDHHWGPGWVDWRHGGGVIGWRPQAPGGRPGHDAHWRFQNENVFANGHIHGRTLDNPAEGLRVTQPIGKGPTFAGRPSIHASAVMATRHSPGNLAGANGGFRPSSRPPQQAFRQPAYRPQHPQYRQPPAYRQPPPQQYRQPAYRPTYQQRPTYTQRPTYPTYQRPAYTSRPTYAPSRPSYSAPSRPSYSAPSRPSYSAPSRPSYSAPSHSSSSPSSSHSSGGGGHHR